MTNEYDRPYKQRRTYCKLFATLSYTVFYKRTPFCFIIVYSNDGQFTQNFTSCRVAEKILIQVFKQNMAVG